MHDAAEAYLGDIPTPLKSVLSGYSERENELMGHIEVSLRLPVPDKTTRHKIKGADTVALVTEARQLTLDTNEWGVEYQNIRSHACTLRPLTPKEAKLEFLHKYYALQHSLIDGAHRSSFVTGDRP